MGTTTLLEARAVTKVFDGGLVSRKATVALEDLSLVIKGEPPAAIAVVGESGSGKTTLVRLLLGLARPTQGQVVYRGNDISALSRTESRVFRREAQAVFQDPYGAYNPFYKIDHVLAIPVAKFRLASSWRQARSLIEEALAAVGLRPEEILGRYPHQLSGGQRQRVMVARALLLRPRLIVADEPVSMVDASLRASILSTLQAINREFAISLLYVSHDLVTAYQICRNMLVLYRGSVVEVGDVECVVRRPAHPYTQLLISSIPEPNPNVRWSATVGRPAATPAVRAGCRFAHRCPRAIPVCQTSQPPLYRTSQHQAVACHLYTGETTLERERLSEVFE